MTETQEETHKRLEDAKVYHNKAYWYNELQVSVYQTERESEESFVQLFSPGKDAIISIPLSEWNLITKLVAQRIETQEITR